LDESSNDRRAKLLEARALRETAAIAKQQEHELVCLELEAKFCEELGPRGQAWDMCNEDNTCGEGPICIRLADAVAHKAWQASGSAPEDKERYVTPWIIFPDRFTATAILGRRPELLSRAVMTLNRLFGYSQGVLQGKY
jgi:hypothetical protein